MIGGKIKDVMKREKKKGNEEVARKLEEAFKNDATTREACLYAGISETCFYDWREQDIEFAKRMESAQNYPFLKAREGLIKNIEREDLKAIDIFLKKRDPRYKDKAEVEMSATVEGVDIEIS